MQTLVECELEIRLVLAPERSLPVAARLIYRADDPYAAHIAFHVGQEASVTWTFARELLVEGVFRPCGEGDVRVWPVKVQGRDLICVALSSPDGDALLQMSASVVSRWLGRTLHAVAPGRESQVLGLDEALADLLNAVPGNDVCVRDQSQSEDTGEAEV